MLGKMNVLTEKILEINPLVQAGLSFDYVSFQFGLMPYQHGSTHEGIHVSFQEIQEVLPTVDYFHPKRSKDWGAMYDNSDNSMNEENNSFEKLRPNLGDGRSGPRNYKLI